MKHGLLLTVLTMLLVLSPVVSAQAGGLPPSEARTAAEVPKVPLPDADEETPYTLSAAYPNPFRTRTQFDLRVDETQHVSVEVYNILGQRVRTLFEGTLQKNDERTFTIEARNLPSGLYLYRISGETFTAARRVTLVR